MTHLRLAALLLATAPLGAAQICTPELSSAHGPHGAFGSALAMERFVLAVGAPESDIPGSIAGAYPYGRAEVFEYDAVTGAWSAGTVLGPSPSPLPVVNHRGFASALTLSRDSAGALWVFCAWPDDIAGGNGTVRPFRRTPQGWVEEAPIFPPMATATGRFGISLAATADVLVVGEQLSDGRVHVFERDAQNAWVHLQTLTPPAPVHGTFGASVGISGGLGQSSARRIAVGDPGHPASLSGTGSVELFLRQTLVGATWTHAGALVGSPGVLHDRFGAALSFREGRLVVGDPERPSSAGGSGVAFVYLDSLASLQPGLVLDAPAAGGPAAFASAVAMGRRAVLVGAPAATVSGLSGAGEATGATRPDDGYSPFAATGPYTLLAPATNAHAGAAVACGEAHGAFGAPGAERVGIVLLDAARDVDADQTPDACESVAFQSTICFPLFNSTGLPARLHIEGDPTAPSGALVLAVDQLPPHSFGYLLTSRVSTNIPVPGGTWGSLCLAVAVGRYTTSVLDSGGAGRVGTSLGTAMFPQPNGAVPGVPGDTWYFQYWHRDMTVAGPTSNFSETVGVTLR